MPSDCPALVTRGALHSWGPLGGCQSEQRFWAGYNPQGTVQTVDWGTPPHLSVKVTLLVLKLQTEGQASGWALTGYGAALKECMLWKPSSCSPSSCFSLLVSPRKETIHLTEAPKFANAAQGTPPDYLALVVSRAYAFGHLRTIHICITFRSCCPRVWLLVCESRCWDPTLWTLRGLSIS